MENNTAIPPSVLINGFAEYHAKYEDGTTELVRIQLIPVRDMQRLHEASQNPSSFVEYVCGKQAGWADKLSEESLYEIDEKASEMNVPRLARFASRQKRVAEKLAAAFGFPALSTK
jgi:hypothetical protein